MTFDEMVTFVRTQADADAADAPEAMLLVHARVGYNDVLSRRSQWDHFSVMYTHNTVIGQAEYGLVTLTPDDLDTVSSVSYVTGGVRHRLTYMTLDDAELQFGSAVNMARPVAWTLNAGALILYPIPGEVVELEIRGFRKAATWPNGAGSEPDLPAEFHDAIAWYMLSGFYQSQEDLQIAGMYLNEYQQQVDRLVGGYSTKQFSARPLIMGGQGPRRRTFLEHVRGQLE